MRWLAQSCLGDASPMRPASQVSNVATRRAAASDAAEGWRYAAAKPHGSLFRRTGATATPSASMFPCWQDQEPFSPSIHIRWREPRTGRACACRFLSGEHRSLSNANRAQWFLDACTNQVARDGTRAVWNRGGATRRLLGPLQKEPVRKPSCVMFRTCLRS